MGDILYEFMWELLSYDSTVIGLQKDRKQSPRLVEMVVVWDDNGWLNLS